MIPGSRHDLQMAAFQRLFAEHVELLSEFERVHRTQARDLLAHKKLRQRLVAHRGEIGRWRESLRT